MSDDPIKDALAQFIDERIAAALTRATKPANDEFLSTDEAAEFASVTPGTIRRWVRSKRLKRYNAGTHIRVRKGELETLLTGPVVETPTDRAMKKFAAK